MNVIIRELIIVPFMTAAITSGLEDLTEAWGRTPSQETRISVEIAKTGIDNVYDCP